MKKNLKIKYLFVLVSFLMFSSICNAQLKIIKDTCTKTFSIGTLGIDKNSSGEMEAGEFGDLKDGEIMYITLDYQDFDEAGNYMKIKFDRFKEVAFQNVKYYKGDDPKKGKAFILEDSTGDSILMLMKPKDKWILIIDNLSLIQTDDVQ